jgi:hypothetical protein
VAELRPAWARFGLPRQNVCGILAKFYGDGWRQELCYESGAQGGTITRAAQPILSPDEFARRSSAFRLVSRLAAYWPGGVKADVPEPASDHRDVDACCDQVDRLGWLINRIQRVVTLNLGTAKHAKARGSRSGVQLSYSPVRYPSAAVSPPAILILESHLDAAGAQPM